jgi:hypothetical protein
VGGLFWGFPGIGIQADIAATGMMENEHKLLWDSMRSWLSSSFVRVLNDAGPVREVIMQYRAYKHSPRGTRANRDKNTDRGKQHLRLVPPSSAEESTIIKSIIVFHFVLALHT